MENEDNICPDVDNCVEELKLPGMLEMAKNLMRDGTQIVKNAASGNSTIVEDSVRDSRWSTCMSCPRLQNDRCLECGCFMKIKVAFVTSKCPLDKW